jgi:hypothetical protein
MFVFLANLDAETKRVIVRGQPEQIVGETPPSPKIIRAK